MDKFILYKENINVSENIIYSIGNSLLTFIIAATILYCLYNIVALFFTPPINNKQRFLPIIQILILAITLYGLNEAFKTEKVKNYNHQFEEQTVQLKDIKELIHVEGDKLTIDPLTNKSKNYYYSSDRYKKNEKQLFRIDHDDIFEKYKLVDEKNNEIKITKEDYEELRKGDK
jgi:hypothetical protein